jgi:pilus assembly protein CpaE
MPFRFTLYYFSDDIGQRLQKIVNRSPHGVIVHSSALTEVFPPPVNNDTDIFFIEYREEIDALDLWLETLKNSPQRPFIFLYLQEANTDTLLRALRLGVQECFIDRLEAEDLENALKRLTKDPKTLSTGEKTQVVSFLGCKGGVGVTFMVVNLAYTMAQGWKEPSLLVDLDLRSADVSSFLDIQPRYTILDIIENFDRIDPQYLQDVIYTKDKGLDVLPGPVKMEDSELVNSHHLEKILQYIRIQHMYHWLIIDLGNVLDEITLKSIERSDQVFLITHLNIPSLRNAKKILEMLQILGFNAEKVQVIANGYHKSVDIKPKEGAKFLGQDFFAIFSFDHEAAVQSVNEGRTVMEILPQHRLANEFTHLARLLHEEEAGAALSKGWFTPLTRLLKWRGKS